MTGTASGVIDLTEGDGSVPPSAIDCDVSIIFGEEGVVGGEEVGFCSHIFVFAQWRFGRKSDSLLPEKYPERKRRSKEGKELKRKANLGGLQRILIT